MSHRLPSARVSLFLEVDRHVCARLNPYLARVTDKHSMRCEMSRISRPRPIGTRYTPTRSGQTFDAFCYFLSRNRNQENGVQEPPVAREMLLLLRL
jgi:hypothetical protein